MTRYLAVFSAVVLVVVSGLAHGLWTSRWHSPQDLQDAIARVPRFPLTFGDWQGRELEADAREFAMSGAQGYWARRYENKDSKVALSVILMCGPAGRMAVHTPDVCYRGAGYEMAGAADRVDVPIAGAASPARLWTARFVKEQPVPGTPLRLFWTWGAAGAWQAPDWPRAAFAGEPALYKVYVARELPSANEPVDNDPALAFLRAFLPELNRTLFPSVAAARSDL